MTKRYPFSHDGRYEYGFVSSGLFTLLTKEGESLYDEALPLFEKLGSHLLWVVFWILLIFGVNLLFSTYLDRLFMAEIFFHLFLFGSRLTTLLLHGGVRAVLFPPLWIRLTRAMQRGGGIEVLHAKQFERHPGLLVNLALIQLGRGQREEAAQNISRAVHFCPDHPVLLALQRQLAPFEGKG